jgi:hypothetical protein
MISRKALLISAPLGGRGVPGVNADLEATRNFLLSPRGGAWNKDEITLLENPTLEALTDAIHNSVADYNITFFSGGGFADGSGNRFLILNGGDFFMDTELLNDSPKQLVLVDACREVFTEEIFHFTGRPNEFEKARMMYDKWIERCEPGQLIIHSTEQNTNTGKNTGGVFTQKLLQVASSVPAVENKFNLKSIYAAGSETPDLMREEGCEFSPAISYEKGNVKLPFAMAMPSDQKKIAAREELVTNLAFGLLILGIIFGKD